MISALAAAGGAAVPVAGAAEAELKGVYEPLELRRKERDDIIDTADQYHDMFARRSLLYQDEVVLPLVRGVGAAIAPEPTDDYIRYEFHVIRDPSPNAFALPNGRVYIHTGMLARLNDQSELAAVLGHEITHVAGHHGILSYRITAKRLAIQLVGGGFGALLGQLRYSRQLEQEADDRSAVLLAGSAYDPHGMTDVLEMLNEDFEGLDPRYASVWVTHPDPDARIESSRLLLEGYLARTRDPGLYDAAIYSLRALTLRDYIQDDYPYTAIALAESFLERYPDDPDLRMALGDAQRILGPRPEALAEDFSKRDARRNLYDRIRNSRGQRMDELLATEAGVAAQAANLESARRTYQSILDDDPAYWPAYRGLGEVFEAQGNDRDAGRAYLTYVREAPDADDRPVILGRLTAIRDRLLEEEPANE
jgi:predicted Zn-dependent protease